MAAIDPRALQTAMDKAGVNQAQLVEALGLRGVHISPSYLARIVKGSRRLSRNPVLRAEIARSLDVPMHWIEAERPDPDRLAS